MPLSDESSESSFGIDQTKKRGPHTAAHAFRYLLDRYSVGGTTADSTSITFGDF